MNEYLLEQSMKTNAIIVAAGSGTRAKIFPPKQYQQLANKPVLARTLNVFLKHPEIEQVTVVLSSKHQKLFADIVQPYLIDDVAIAIGGATRTQSVVFGLNSMQKSAASHVLIHDGVRPFASNKLIDRVIDALTDYDAVVPGIPVADALWRQDNHIINESVCRDGVIRVQTPQGFKISTLNRAYELSAGNSADDDAAIAAAAGIKVYVIKGQEDNMKLTTQSDFTYASKQLNSASGIRVGTGFDVHRFTAGNKVILCGISIPHDQSLYGHSDADVAAHAITDAIYGALAQGDIGRWFPPSDPQWKNTDSMIFLRHASNLANELGYNICLVDSTIICEAPKINLHAHSMCKKISSILEIDIDLISIKATTSEGLGFTGRKEGIAAMSTVTLTAR